MKRTNTIEMGKLVIKATYDGPTFLEAVLTSKAMKLDEGGVRDLINALAELLPPSLEEWHGLEVSTKAEKPTKPKLELPPEDRKPSPVKKVGDKTVAGGMLVEDLDKSGLKNAKFYA